ncbi:hypothetical protein GUITHDRAFT_135797 [Guillardia theta CCMP2712]|uniref:Uncharacterized protein n=1 Tax=Guillardia theta (strain CCMP2712) TaxID=905079 RepID=L1JMV6_GUITC|nr:hypothetical protein GUITHDRAFT_135797 [Guillardia theta CCMP2712]EKX49609.1 hypothetical protein GUITHDRAFT_135797 [Guillardia theta CCMP2712]|eukprot:XP_005836589.1 hypothetical protein GUITHDRAFT_135797 [Guillardia theta CCMP2712]
MPSYYFSGSEHEDIVEPIITFSSEVPERVEFDVQDCGIAELQLIRRDVERLELLLRGSSNDFSATKGQLRTCMKLQILRAELELAKKMMVEGNHIPAKSSLNACWDRYLMKAWARARSSSDIPDRLLLASGYLEGNSEELNRVSQPPPATLSDPLLAPTIYKFDKRDQVMEVAVEANKRDVPSSLNVQAYTSSLSKSPDSSYGHKSQSDRRNGPTPPPRSSSSFCTLDDSVEFQDRGKQVAQGNRFLSDALYLANEYPGVNNAAAWELVDFLVRKGNVDPEMQRILQAVIRYDFSWNAAKPDCHASSNPVRSSSRQNRSSLEEPGKPTGEEEREKNERDDVKAEEKLDDINVESEIDQWNQLLAFLKKVVVLVLVVDFGDDNDE